MQKLRNLYAQTQRFANNDFDKITVEKIKGYQEYSERLYRNSLSKEEYQNLDEINYYTEKYKEILNSIQEGKKKFYKKQKLQSEIKYIVSQNPFDGKGTPGGQTKTLPMPPAVQKQPKIQSKLDENFPQNNTIYNKISQIAESKSVINSFFDSKKNEIQKSKIGFSNIIEAMPLASRKYAVKKQSQPSNLNNRPNQNHKNVIENNEQIRKMQGQIQKLRRELANKNNEKQFNMGLLKAQKQSYQNQIRGLTYQISKLQIENQTLKDSSQRNFRPQPQMFSTIPISEPEIQDNSPYCIKYKQNNIYKLSNNFQNTKIPVKMNQQPEYKSLKVKNQILEEQGFTINKRPPRSEIIPNLYEQQQLNYDDRVKENSVKSSHLNLNRSQVYDENKNIAFRSKIAFFKQSILLYRSDEFDVAIKSTDLVKYESKKIIIYVNNKTGLSHNVDIKYKVDSSYYTLNVKRKLHICPENNQGKQQIEVKLINNYDLDSLIQATLTINSKTIHFLIPTMFIQFVNRRPPKTKVLEELKIEKVNPISSFSSLNYTQQIIPSVEKNFDNYREQNGVLYGVSKHHEGYINLKWVHGFLEVQTIKPWACFISYLFLKEY